MEIPKTWQRRRNPRLLQGREGDSKWHQSKMRTHKLHNFWGTLSKDILKGCCTSGKEDHKRKKKLDESRKKGGGEEHGRLLAIKTTSFGRKMKFDDECKILKEKGKRSQKQVGCVGERWKVGAPMHQDLRETQSGGWGRPGKKEYMKKVSNKKEGTWGRKRTKEEKRRWEDLAWTQKRDELLKKKLFHVQARGLERNRELAGKQELGEGSRVRRKRGRHGVRTIYLCHHIKWGDWEGEGN